MGCLVVNATLIQSALSATASAVRGPMACDVAVRNMLQKEKVRCTTGMPVAWCVDMVRDMLSEEKVKCSLVCSINRDEKYVIVSPDVVWLPQDWGVDGEFAVYSNVDWIIE